MAQNSNNSTGMKECAVCGNRVEKSVVECPLCKSKKLYDVTETDTGEANSVDSISSATPDCKFCSICGTRHAYAIERCDICGGKEFFDTYQEYDRSRIAAIERIVDSKCSAMYERLKSEIEAGFKKLRKSLSRQMPVPDNPENTKVKKLDFVLTPDYPTLENYNRREFKIDGKTLDKYVGTSADVLIPYGVEQIASRAFDTNMIIKTVIMPPTVKTIGDWGFCACRMLTAVELPESLVEIGRHAFASCEKLRAVYIPKNVENIGQGVFGSCENLESMTVDPDNPVYYSVDNCIIHKPTKTLVCGFKASKIPTDGSVAAIGDWAITGHRKIKCLYVPASVKKIGMYALGWCTFMQDIIFDGTLSQWHHVTKCTFWNNEIAKITVHCRDGEIIVTEH